jgi:hypothetical protein
VHVRNAYSGTYISTSTARFSKNKTPICPSNEGLQILFEHLVHTIILKKNALKKHENHSFQKVTFFIISPPVSVI